MPLKPPRFIVSTADEGTITSAPFSFKPSKSMFIARRCNAVGLLIYALDASANESAICFSDSPSMTRACRSRSACAWRDMASSRSGGMTISRISTDCTVTPQGVVRSSMICCNSLSNELRPTRMSASILRPMMSRSAVCAAQSTAAR